MADPDVYERGYSFAGFQANNPTKPLPGASVDNELDNLGASLAGAIEAVKDVRRADGALKNGIVTADALSPGLFTGLQPAEIWTTGKQYGVNRVVSFGTGIYRAVEDHVASGSFAVDLADDKWVMIADFSAATAQAEEARDIAIGARDAAELARDAAEEARDASAGFAGVAEGASTEAGLARDQAVAARGDAIDAAGDAADARDAAILARGGAEGARDAAVLAQGAAELARDEAQALVDELEGAGVASVASRTALKALTATAGAVAVLDEGGRSGVFIFRAGNYTARVASDPSEGVYIEADDTAASAGAWVRLYSGHVHAGWWGVVPDGTTDATPGLAAACAFLGLPGGTIELPPGKVLLDTQFTLTSSVSLKGPYIFAGRNGPNLGALYNDMSQLIINPATALLMEDGSTLSGCLIVQKGLTFPVGNHITAYQGTAISLQGDDIKVENCQILGFARAIYSSGPARPKFVDLLIDSKTGIELTECLDVAQFERIHCWPFGTIDNDTTGWQQQLARSGRAISIHDNVDWAKLNQCFSYGYAVGIEIDNVNSTIITACGCDNVFSGGVPLQDAIGIAVAGASNETKIIGVQLAAQKQAGIYVATSAGVPTIITDLTCWGGSTHGILIDGGDVQITGGVIRNADYGVTVTNTASAVRIDNVRFNNITARPIFSTLEVTKVRVGNLNDFGNFSGGSPVNSSINVQGIPSSDPLVLPVNGDFFFVTGSTSFGNIANMWTGRRVTLLFGGSLTVFNGGSFFLDGGANFAASSGKTLNLIGSGNSAAIEISAR